jgi:hypothetical protein
MLHRDMRGPRLTALAAFGWLLLSYPILTLVDRPVLVLGIPVLYAWLFGVWAALIVLVAWVVERRMSDTQAG